MGLFSRKSDLGKGMKGISLNSTSTEDYNFEKITLAIDESGTRTPGQKSSVKAAAKMLNDGEKVKAAYYGIISLEEPQGKLKVSSFSMKNKLAGVVLITDNRLLYVSDTGFRATKSIALQDIRSIDDSSYSSAFGFNMRVKSITSTLVIEGNKKTLIPFGQKIEAAANEARAQAQVAHTTVVQQNSTADELMKYKQLCDAGAITEDEYQAIKKRLLGL